MAVEALSPYRPLMIFRRIPYYARVVVSGHLCNWLWRSRLERRRARGRAIRKAADAYLRPYAAVAAAAPEAAPDHSEPRRIFSLWLQGEEQAPPLVRACLDSIRRNADAEFVLLDEHTLFDRIDLPEAVLRKWREGKMKPAHFADVCRLELLYRYGGVWMDGTDYLDAPLPAWLWESDFFVYRGGDRLQGAYSGIQNCFIRAAKGSYLLQVWREAVLAYWEQENSAVDYFVHQMLLGAVVDAHPRAAALFAEMPALNQDPTHVLWYDYADRPFDEALLHDVCAKALFQKTDYKTDAAKNPVPGSFADHLLAPYR